MIGSRRYEYVKKDRPGELVVFGMNVYSTGVEPYARSILLEL